MLSNVQYYVLLLLKIHYKTSQVPAFF